METENPGTSMIEGASMTALKNTMLDHLSNNTIAYFKSQQLGDPELTPEEKKQIAESILSTNEALFLSRFGPFLTEEHLKYFKRDIDKSTYEVTFYIQELENRLKKNKQKAVVKNRRLEALKQLALEGEYFSEAEMKKRNPLLYEQLVGQFLTEEEKNEKESFRFTEESLSTFLLERYDRDQSNKLLMSQMDEEDSVMEEEEDESEEETTYFWGEGKQKKPTEISVPEKRMLFEEFRSHMYANFLQGKDSGFDYSNVDANAEYDDLDTVNRDEEEKYFDSESPDDVMVSEDVDDPLDVFMVQLNKSEEEQDLSKKMKALGT